MQQWYSVCLFYAIKYFKRILCTNLFENVQKQIVAILNVKRLFFIYNIKNVIYYLLSFVAAKIKSK